MGKKTLTHHFLFHQEDIKVPSFPVICRCNTQDIHSFENTFVIRMLRAESLVDNGI